MPFQKRTNFTFPLDGIKTFAAAEGLDDFIKKLEKEFFAEVTFKCQYRMESEKTDLILDMKCNFGLTESLHHFSTGNWGGFSCDPENQEVSSSFNRAFAELSALNKGTIDISELSLHFKDTSIIVSRTNDHSIPEQLGAIMGMASEHFVYITKGLTEMPYEIFVPVFEESQQNGVAPENGQHSYFEHWGLYFEADTQHDVMVYSLEHKTMAKEDFFLLD
nr:hypothetical protein [Allomuricauda sp.]